VNEESKSRPEKILRRNHQKRLKEKIQCSRPPSFTEVVDGTMGIVFEVANRVRKQKNASQRTNCLLRRENRKEEKK